MSQTKLSRLELKIMQVLWTHGPSAVRGIQQHLPPKRRPAHTTVQTILTRLEAKGAARRTHKIGNAHIFEAVITRDTTQRVLVNELLGFFGGRIAPLVSHLIETGQLTLEHVEDARKLLRKPQKRE
jgi:predicted transcriptional regulator